MKKEVTPQAGCVQPVPNVIVSCRDKDGKNNALVVGFAANVSITPPMAMVGIVPHRHSYKMIKESGVFVMNFPAVGFEKEWMVLGTKSGKDHDKFAELDLKWEDGKVVDAPILTDCPIAIECKVVDSICPGSHELFIGSIEAIHCDEKYLDEKGNIKWKEVPLLPIM